MMATCVRCGNSTLSPVRLRARIDQRSAGENGRRRPRIVFFDHSFGRAEGAPMRLKSTGSAIPAYFPLRRGVCRRPTSVSCTSRPSPRAACSTIGRFGHTGTATSIRCCLIRRGSIDVQLDGESSSVTSPAAIVVPPGVVHSFGFEPDTQGFVISFAGGLGAGADGGLTDADRDPGPSARTLRRSAQRSTPPTPGHWRRRCCANSAAARRAVISRFAGC